MGDQAGQEGVAAAHGIGDGDGSAGFPIPSAVAQETGAALAGGDAHEGAAVAGGEGAGVGFLGVGGGGGVAGGEAGGFLGVELEEGGAGGELVDAVEVVVGGAQVDVADAHRGGREHGEEPVESGTVEGERWAREPKTRAPAVVAARTTSPSTRIWSQATLGTIS